MPSNMRQYQRDAANSVVKEWREHRKILLVLPTGTGKTVVFSNIANYMARFGRVLILAHRDELLQQAADKLKKFTGADSAFEKAGTTSMGADALITVGSVQTLSREKRLDKFPSDYFSTIIVDEAHHCLSDSYKRVLEHFSTAKVLGVTATPDRGDRRNLGQFFDKIAYEYSMRDAIKDGFLCPIKAQMIPLQIDLSDVTISQGDFALNAVGNVLDPYLEEIADNMVKYAFNRKTVVFLPLIATSQRFRDLLNERGFRAAEVNGMSADRKEILEDFDNGKYNVLCNSMLLTEGWDCPSVDCVVVLRPTKIRSLYQQMVGRGTRPAPGKDHLLILDFLWMTERHDLCKPSGLLAKDAEIAGKIDKKIEEGFEEDIMEAEEAATKSVLEERENKLAEELAEQRKKKAGLVDPLQYAMSIADEDLSNYVPTFLWEMAPPTQKQIRAIESFGIDTSSVQNLGHANMIIDRLSARAKQGLATPKQIRLLECKGFLNVGTWSKQDATKMISRIAENRWMVPFGIVPKEFKPQEDSSNERGNTISA